MRKIAIRNANDLYNLMTQVHLFAVLEKSTDEW